MKTYTLYIFGSVMKDELVHTEEGLSLVDAIRLSMTLKLNGNVSSVMSEQSFRRVFPLYL